MSHDMPMPMAPPDAMNMDDMSMHMTLYWGRNAIVLFQGWPGHSLGMYILSVFFVFFLSLGVELLSLFQAAKPRGVPVVAAQAGVYAIKTALVYLVMLAVMSFNLGILIAAVVGHTLGFFVVKVRAMLVATRVEPPMAETESKV